MEWVDFIIKVGALITAAILIWRAIVFFVHLSDDIKETKNDVKKHIKNVESIPEIEKHCKENYLTGLRLTIMSKDMPLGERIIAGGKYIELGGNGDVKKFVESELHVKEKQKD